MLFFEGVCDIRQCAIITGIRGIIFLFGIKVGLSRKDKRTTDKLNEEPKLLLHHKQLNPHSHNNQD